MHPSEPREGETRSRSHRPKPRPPVPDISLPQTIDLHTSVMIPLAYVRSLGFSVTCSHNNPGILTDHRKEFIIFILVENSLIQEKLKTTCLKCKFPKCNHLYLPFTPPSCLGQALGVLSQGCGEERSDCKASAQ